MAGGNMGDLSFTLTVKSDIEKKMKSYSDAIKQAKKEVDNLQSALANAKTAKDSSAITSLNQQLKEAKANVRDMESNWKRADTRMQQVLDKAHDIDNVLKSMSASSSKAKFFNAADAENAVNRISSAIRSLLELTKGGANAPLFTGEGFRAGIGDVKRGIADVKSGFKDMSKGVKEAERSLNDFGRAENKAAEYYVTRKQRVDDAINALSKKQAELGNLMRNASASDARMLETASRQAEILIQRLVAAKSEYEAMQRLKAQGVPRAALSRTFLGRYTGMSELFGANFSQKYGDYFTKLFGTQFSRQDNLSYNDFISKFKEVVATVKKGQAELSNMNIGSRMGMVGAERNSIWQQVREYSRAYEQLMEEKLRIENVQRGISRALGSSPTRFDLQSRLDEALSMPNGALQASKIQKRIDELDRLQQTLYKLGGQTRLDKVNAEIAEMSTRIRSLSTQFGPLDQAMDKLKQADFVQRGDAIRQRTQDLRQYAETLVQTRAQFLESQRSMMASAYSQGKGILNTEDLNRVRSAYQSITQELSQLRSVMQNLSSYSIRDLFAMGRQNGDFSTVAANVKSRIEQEEQYTRRVEELIAQRQRAAETASRNESERIAQQEAQFNALEAKMREVAALYGQLRTERDNTARLGGNTSQLESEMQRMRELYTELNSMRWGRSGTGSMGSTFVEVDEAVKRANISIKEAKSNVSQMEGMLKANATAARELASAFDRVHNAASKSSQVLSDIKSLFLQGGIVFAAQQFANSIVQTGGDIVQQHIALRSILGDVQKADTIFAQTQQLALQSPFTFQQLNRDVKQLAAFGVDTDRLYDTTKRLADVASGLGVSFERLGLAYGQVKARSWLDGKELRQFAYAGLPMLQKIADLYNDEGKNGRRDYTTSDVRNMITKREVSFEDVDAVFKRLTDEGGQFYNMQFVLSDTLLGKWNKLQDAWTIMLGKFADGSNILGSAFIGVIDNVTTLIQKLDQLSPLVMSFGALFALRKGASVLSSRFGAGTIIADMQKAQTLALTNFQIRQMTQVAEGKITMEQARQNIATEKNLLASKEAANMKYMQLAAEGKLSAFQLGRLAANQQVNLSLVKQLMTTGQISRYQAYLILQAKAYAGTWQGVWAQTKLGVTSLWGSIKGFFTWGNALMVGIGVAMSAVLSHEQKLSELSSKAESVTSKYTNKAAELNDTLTQVNGKISTESIKAMEEALSKAGQLTDEVKDQVAEADTLNEKYEILKNKMQETLTMAQKLKDKNAVSDAIAASGGDSLSEPTDSWISKIHKESQNLEAQGWRAIGQMPGYITDNIAKINELENSIHNFSQGLAGSFDSIDRALKKTTDAAHDSVFYEQVKKLPFEQKIRQILTSDYADDFLEELEKVDKGAYKTAKELSDYINKYNDVFQDIVNYNIPKAVENLKHHFGLLGTDTSRWTKQEVNTFVWMFTQIMTAAGEMSDYVRSKVWQSFLASSGLMNQLNPDKKRVHTYTDPKTHKPWLTLYVGQEGDDKKGHYIIVGFKGGQPVKQYNTAADKPQKPSPTGSSESDTGGKKGKGGKSDADRAAERAARERDRAQREAVRQMQRELDLVKASYEWYDKYYNLIHNKQTALGAVKDVYGEDLKSVGLNWNNADDYVANLKKVRKDIQEKINAGFNTSDMVNLRKNVDNMLQEEDFKKLSKAVDDFASKVSHDMGIINDKFSLYKSILESTGDVQLAANVSQIRTSSGNNGIDVLNTKNVRKPQVFQSDSEKSLIESLLGDAVWETQKNWKAVLDPKTKLPTQEDTDRYNRISNASIDYEKIIGMSNADVEKYVGDLFKDFPEQYRIKGFTEMLEKFRDLKSDEIKNNISAVVDLLKEIKRPEDVRQQAQTQYETTMAYLNAALLRGNKNEYGGIDLNTYNKAVLVAEADRDNKILQADMYYKQFTEDVTGLTQEMANNVSRKAISVLDKQLLAGQISAKEYADGISQINDKLYEFNTKQSDFEAFLTGGIDGYLQNRQQNAIDNIYRGGMMLNANPMSLQGRLLVQKGQKELKDVSKQKEDVKEYTDLNKAIHTTAQTFDDLVGALQPLVDLADTLGNKGISEGVNIGKNAIQSGLGVADSMKGLADVAGGMGMNGVSSVLGKAGPYGAAAAAALSIGNSLINKFGFGAAANKSYQKQAEYLKQIQSTVSDINSNLKKQMENTGGSAVQGMGEKYKANLQNEAAEVRETYYKWSQAHTLHKSHRNRMYTGLDYDEINEYLRSIGYTGGDVGGDSIQELSGEYLSQIRDHFAGMWAKLPEDARGYLNRLIEIESETGDINEATKEIGKTLTDLDTDTLRSEYKDLLDDLDSDNEDLADNLEKHLRNAILSSMISNLYKDQIDNMVAQATDAANTKKGQYVDKNGNVKTHTGGDDIKDTASEFTLEEYQALQETEEDLAEKMRATRDMLKDLYGWSDSNSSSMSSSVKGISEQTADLLAAYLNAIRADVSVIRQLTGVYYEKFDVTIEAQLQQLNMIASNTQRNAEAAERMEATLNNLYELFNRSAVGTKQIGVKVFS